MTRQHVDTTRTRHRARLETTLPAFPLASEAVAPWPGDDEQARADAVAEARAVLETGWRRWAVDAGLDPVPALRLRAPRVTVVGERPEHYRLVALIRFTFTAEGLEFHGCARGPAEAPYFSVQRVAGVGEPLPAPSRRRWWWHRRP